MAWAARRPPFFEYGTDRGAQLAPAFPDLVIMGDELMNFVAVGAQQPGFVVHRPVFAAAPALVSVMDLKNAHAQPAPVLCRAILQRLS